MADKEQFKDIPGYKGYYMVSDRGTVKSLDMKQDRIHPKLLEVRSFSIKGRILRPHTNKKGYKIVTLAKDKTQKTFAVHQLMAMAFLGHKVHGHTQVVDHIDNNPGNNILGNLNIVSARVNVSKDRVKKHGDYTGVTLSTGQRVKKWQATIYHNAKHNYLGRYKTQLEAKSAYNNYKIQNGII